MLNVREKKRSPVTVRVVGGLGNQLFCYFAGRYLASLNRSPLVLDMSDIRSGKSAHDVTIESFNIDAEIFSQPKSLIGNFVSRFLHKAKKLGVFPDSSNYFSDVIGYDPELRCLSVPVTLNGYFQSYKYFYSEDHFQNSLSLRKPSLWFQEQEERFQAEPVISVHVRRGDYKKLQHSYGLLGASYYNACFDRLSSAHKNLPIYVFSDDIFAAKKLLNFLDNYDVKWVEPPVGTDPAESLVLMSKARVNVIANSTFSWWGAALSANNNLVYAPKKWFKDLPDPKFLYPPSWIQIDSHWEA